MRGPLRFSLKFVMVFQKIKQAIWLKKPHRALMSRGCQRGVNVTKTSFLFFYFFFSHKTRQTAYHSKELFSPNKTVQKYFAFFP